MRLLVNQNLILDLSFSLKKLEGWEKIPGLSHSALWWGQEPGTEFFASLLTTDTHTEHCTLSQNSENICWRSHLNQLALQTKTSDFQDAATTHSVILCWAPTADPVSMPELGTWRSCLSLSEFTAPPHQDRCEVWQSNKKLNLLNRTDHLNVVCGRTSLGIYWIQGVYAFFFFFFPRRKHKKVLTGVKEMEDSGVGWGGVWWGGVWWEACT